MVIEFSPPTWTTNRRNCRNLINFCLCITSLMLQQMLRTWVNVAWYLIVLEPNGWQLRWMCTNACGWATKELRNKKQEAQLMLTNPWDAFRGQSRSPTWYHSIWWVHSFLLVCYSNFVPKSRRLSNVRTSKMLWLWNPDQGSLKVIETGIVPVGSQNSLTKN